LTESDNNVNISYKVFVTDVKESVMADLAESQVEKYHIIRKLAEGGFAEVYMGEHIFTKRSAAIKVLKETIKTGSKEEIGFKQEAITIAKLEHQHIIPLLDCGLTPDSRPYITMSLCETDLAKRLRGSILSLDQVLEYAVPIAQALFHAHEHGVVHRDVKPQNVLISLTGTLLLSDFGIAVKSTTGQAPLESVVGTAPYMAPEQFSGHARRATDQYSLGIMIYEWLCGKNPFVGNHDPDKFMMSYGYLHNTADIPSFASKDVTTVNPEIEQAVRRALAKNPDDRFKTVLDFVGTLENVRTRLIRQAQEAREKAQQQEAEKQRRKQQEYIHQLQKQIQQEKNYSVKVEKDLIREQEAKRLVENSYQELQQQLNELKVALQNSVQQVETLTEQQALRKNSMADIQPATLPDWLLALKRGESDVESV
jgi:serine/threonine protein kinase